MGMTASTNQVGTQSPQACKIKYNRTAIGFKISGYGLLHSLLHSTHCSEMSKLFIKAYIVIVITDK